MYLVNKDVGILFQIVFGILNLSENTGQVLLCDDTGSIEVVTCCYHGDREAVTECDHVCTGTCDSDKLDIDDKFTCPYVQACYIGKLVAVTTFEIISETMVTRNVLISNNGEKSRSGSEKYLLLDMRNVIYIGNNVQSVKVDNQSVKVDNKFQISDKTSDPSINIDNDMHERTKAKQNGNGITESCQSTSCSSYKSYNMQRAKCDIYSANVVQSVPDANGGIVDHEGHVKSDTKQGTHVLHKHVRTDGTLMFCRKPDCYEESVKQRTENDVGSELKLTSKSNTGSAKENNQENITRTPERESGKLSVLPYRLGQTAFKIKPVSNRKRPVDDSHVDNLNDDEFSKMPRTDLKRKSVINKETFVDVIDEPVQDIVCNDQNSDVTRLVDSDRDVIVYVENKGSFMLEDKQPRFSMECTVVKKEGSEKVWLKMLM